MRTIVERHTGFFWSKTGDFLLASGVFVRLAEHFNIPTGFMARVMGILKPVANHKRNTFHSSRQFKENVGGTSSI